MRTQSGRLAAFQAVVSPPVLKNEKDMIPAIHLWEQRVISLETRYSETIPSSLKTALMVNMLPKDYQGTIMTN